MNFRVTEADRDVITNSFASYVNIHSLPSPSEEHPNRIRFKLYFEGYVNGKYAERNQRLIDMIKDTLREYRQYGPPHIIPDEDQNQQSDNDNNNSMGMLSGGSTFMAREIRQSVKKIPESHQYCLDSIIWPMSTLL